MSGTEFPRIVYWQTDFLLVNSSGNKTRALSVLEIMSELFSISKHSESVIAFGSN